jgi:hypothetical protein
MKPGAERNDGLFIVTGTTVSPGIFGMIDPCSPGLPGFRILCDRAARHRPHNPKILRPDAAVGSGHSMTRSKDIVTREPCDHSCCPSASTCSWSASSCSWWA